jgi:multisubunit Na+/H+ antiporter MnhC subunit
MEWIVACAIGLLAGSGVWLILRPRTYQLIIGLTLLAYAVNLFIFGMGRIVLNAPRF